MKFQQSFSLGRQSIESFHTHHLAVSPVAYKSLLSCPVVVVVNAYGPLPSLASPIKVRVVHYYNSFFTVPAFEPHREQLIAGKKTCEHRHTRAMIDISLSPYLNFAMVNSGLNHMMTAIGGGFVAR
jgi:hypothetical protein